MTVFSTSALKKTFLFCLILGSFYACKKSGDRTLTVRRYVYPHNTYVHDPSMISQGGTDYLFYTGDGIQMITSKDMLNWSPPVKIFNAPTSWMLDKVPGFDNFIWAPDISFYAGQYFLFYAISQFGVNNSAIGLATNTTLDNSDSSYKWIDHGKIIESYNGISIWNSIDPNLVTSEDGTPWLVFGSFYTGIHIVKLSRDRMNLAHDINNLPILASRGDYQNWNPVNGPGTNNIEGAVAYWHAGYFYLFASVDVCCQGLNSTYKIICGRSVTVDGPYTDDKNKPMATGGQLLLLEGDSNWHGVGGESVFHSGNTDYMVFHAYDVHDNGVAKLRIEPITWSSGGWPAIQNAY